MESLVEDLHRAVDRHQSVADVHNLIARGADVDGIRLGKAPLHIAADRAFQAEAELLIAAGADINIPDDEGRTPLMLAARGGWYRVVTMLIVAGADVQAKDLRGRTALHWAARFSRPLIVEALIEAGADIHAQDLDGDTPAHGSFMDLASVRLLREAGADFGRKNLRGDTAIDLVRERATSEAQPGQFSAVLEFLESGQIAQRPPGWRVSERWDDYAAASTEKAPYRVKIEAAIAEMKDDILTRGPFPHGSFIIFATKENADSIAALLREAGCPHVDVMLVSFDPASGGWSMG
jgi:ankyrin repeat protein